MAEYIERETVINAHWKALYSYEDEMEAKFMADPELDVSEWFFHRIFVQTMSSIDLQVVLDAPTADVSEEENILKFYYVRSIDDYWIGQRVDNFYYAEFEPRLLHWVWTHSRYLPWGEHVISPTSAWKEHTYPTEPEEIPFSDWMRGFVKKYFSADALIYPKGRWVPEKEDIDWGCSVIRYRCSNCGRLPHYDKEAGTFLRSAFCPKCGARMEDAGGN